MRLKTFLLTEFVTKPDADQFVSKWKMRLKTYGITHIEFSTHFFVDRMNHSRNKPPVSIEEMDSMLESFFNKVGSQFKKDVEAVKSHSLKPRGKNKGALNYNELEIAMYNKKSGIKFVIVLKQDRKQKGTAMVLPVTIVRDKNKLIHTQGELIEV